MDEIKRIAKVLSEKNSWVRDSAYELMMKWEDDSECGEDLFSDTTVKIDGEFFYLATGHNELKDHFMNDISKDAHFTKKMKMKDLRIFLSRLPEMVEEIKKKMKLKLNIEFNFLQ